MRRCHALYAIADEEHVKIGRVSYHADSWKWCAYEAARARRAELQTGNPRLLRVIALRDLSEIPDRQAAQCEIEVHAKLGAVTRRALGEWFLNTASARSCLRAFGFAFMTRIV